MNITYRYGWFLILPFSLLAGCETYPVAPGETADSVVPETAVPVRKLTADARRAVALELDAGGDKAAALIAWEVVRLLAPDDAEARLRTGTLQQEISDGVARHVAAGDASLSGGDRRKAKLAWLRALALDPDNGAVIGRLRRMSGRVMTASLESARRRAAEAIVPEPPATAESQPVRLAIQNPVSDDSRSIAAGSTVPDDRIASLSRAMAEMQRGQYELATDRLRTHLQAHPEDAEARTALAAALGQQALVRARQDDLDGAAGLLDQADVMVLNSAGGDAAIAALRLTLSDFYYREGQLVFAENVDRAIDLWERSLHFNPAHALAGPRLRRAYKVRETLGNIDGSRDD